MEDDTDALQEQPSPRAMALARAIRAARGEMPQMEFRDYAGKPQSVVSNWENGKQTPSLEALCAMEEALGLPLGTLAAQAGYFSVEAAIAVGLPGDSIASLWFDRRRDALRAVRSADDLGLTVRLSGLRRAGAGAARWLVEVFAAGDLSVDAVVGGE